MVEDVARFLVVPFSVPAGNDDLGAETESQSGHEYGHAIHSGYCRCPEFDFSDPAQKGSVCHSDKLFHDQAYQNRVCYFPDVMV